MNVVQVSFAVPAKIYDNVAKRAGPLNIRPAEYARRLFEAAWTARVAGERGLPTGDRALDHQVQQVFLLADCEPEYIADALRLPIERVKRILDGWRQAATEIASPPARKAEAPAETKAAIPPPMASEAQPAKTGPMDAGEIAVIRNLWREGKTVAQIADTLGRVQKSVANFASRNRDVCPVRKGEA